MYRLKGDQAEIWAWAPPHEIDSNALTQLKNVASLPWVFHHVAVMPDVHFGKGATVGSVIAMKDAVCPAAVGVDIGCGMAAVRTSLTASDLPNDLRGLRTAIEQRIPAGFNDHRDAARDKGAPWDESRDLSPAVQDLVRKPRKPIG